MLLKTKLTGNKFEMKVMADLELDGQPKIIDRLKTSLIKEMLANGFCRKEIAYILGISLKTAYVWEHQLG